MERKENDMRCIDITRMLSTPALLAGCTLSAQGVHGPNLMPTGGTAIFEIGGDKEFAKYVEWSVLEPQGGVINSNGLYRAPETPGKFTIQGRFSGKSIRTTELIVEVRDKAKLRSGWEISLFHHPAVGYTFRAESLIYFYPPFRRPNELPVVGHMQVEVHRKDGTKLTNYAGLRHPYRDQLREALCLWEAPDFSEVSKVVFRATDENQTLVWQADQRGPNEDISWEMRKEADGNFQFRVAPNWGSQAEFGINRSCYFSWDDGSSWQYCRLGRPRGGQDGWISLAPPEKALLEVPDPLVMLEITHGLYRRTKTTRLKELLIASEERSKDRDQKK